MENPKNITLDFKMVIDFHRPYFKTPSRNLEIEVITLVNLSRFNPVMSEVNSFIISQLLHEIAMRN